MHLFNDLSLENKCSRIDMVPESLASNNVRNSLNGSYFNDGDLSKDINRSRSRSNPRGGEKAISPNTKENLIMEEDEITERIRLQGERLVQMPEIV